MNETLSVTVNLPIWAWAIISAFFVINTGLEVYRIRLDRKILKTKEKSAKQ